MQLTTVGKEIWRGARQAQVTPEAYLRLEEAGAGDPTVQERLRKLKLAQSLRKRKADWAEIRQLVGISRATYYRWTKELRQKGLKGLKPKSKRPKRFRKKALWSPELLIRVETLRVASPSGEHREENPTWGRWPIWLTLCKEGFKISERTVGRLLRGANIELLVYLERHGRVERVASFLARTRRDSAKRRVKRPYAKRKPKAYGVQRPGDLVQVDTLTVTLEPGVAFAKRNTER